MLTTIAARRANVGAAANGLAATSLSLTYPSGVAVDASGTVYISDRTGYYVYEVDGTTNNVTMLAGTGSAGYSGDGGASTSAAVNQPYGVHVDASGNVYWAESGSAVVRKIDASGTVSTIAGTGTSGYSGDGGAATSAQFTNPEDVFVDGAGSVYVADYNNHRIRELTPSFAAAGLSGANSVVPGYEVVIYSVGLVGDGTAQLSGVDVKLSGAVTGFNPFPASSVTALRVYQSTDTQFLPSGDASFGTLLEGIVVDGTTLTIPVTATPPSGAGAYYYVTADIDPGAPTGSAFKAGVPTGNLDIDSGSFLIGSEILSSDANYVEIVPPVQETTAAAGLSGINSVAPSGQVLIYSVGLTGDGVATLDGLHSAVWNGRGFQLIASWLP